MSADAGTQQQSVADALARRVEARRGAESVWVGALRELGAVDRAVYQAVADTPTPELDGPARRLSNAATYSRLWLGIAAVIAVLGGRRGRRAALEGVLAIGVTSATVNLGMKPLAGRRRPDRAGHAVFAARRVADAGIRLVPVRPRRVGVRVRLRGRQAPAGAGCADPVAGGRRRLFASPHRRALSG